MGQKREQQTALSAGAPVKKLFVLDTNVLMQDPSIIFRLEEHDVLVSSVVFEELDKHKNGMDEKNRNARQAVREFDRLQVDFIATGKCLKDGIPLSLTGHSKSHGTLFLGNGTTPDEHSKSGNNDDAIIAAACRHKDSKKYLDVVVLSNDGIVRLKSRDLGLTAEDVRGDVEISDNDVIPNNFHIAPDNFWSELKDVQEKKKNDREYYTLFGSFPKWHIGDFVAMPDNRGKKGFYGQVTSRSKGVAVLRAINPSGGNARPFGAEAKDQLQELALQLLMDQNFPFVALIGVAGTGKTFLSLAAALQQTMERKIFKEVIFTRETVPMGKEIGFLPGDEKEKMDPWMGAMHDNLEALVGNKSSGDEWGRAATNDLVSSKIHVKSMNFFRGRSFSDTLLIVDEAQNLTPKQAKTVISRAGTGSKVVFLGNVAQIDTPYLTEHNNGLVQTIHRFRNGDYLGAGYVFLKNGVRSELADAANKYL